MGRSPSDCGPPYLGTNTAQEVVGDILVDVFLGEEAAILSAEKGFFFSASGISSCSLSTGLWVEVASPSRASCGDLMIQRLMCLASERTTFLLQNSYLCLNLISASLSLYSLYFMAKRQREREVVKE